MSESSHIDIQLQLTRAGFALDVAMQLPARGISVLYGASGSGKTTVLTRRIAHRVGTGSAMPRHVLALTFSRDAASELRRRLRRLELREPVDAGTFHSVALRLLRDRALARNEAPPVLAPDRLRLVREVEHPASGAIRLVGPPWISARSPVAVLPPLLSLPALRSAGLSSSAMSGSAGCAG